MKNVSSIVKTRLLTPEVVARIISVMRPAITGQLDYFGRGAVHVVVLDPVRDGEILFDGIVAGKKSPRYKKNAMAKAKMALRTGEDGNDVIYAAPHLMQEGDIVFAGGVNEDGLIVAASGAQPYVDHAIASQIAFALIAYCAHQVASAQADALKPGGALFLSTPPPRHHRRHQSQ